MVIPISSLSNKTKDVFYETRIYLNSIGGVSSKYIYSPPVSCDYEYIEEMGFEDSLVQIGEFGDFRKKLIYRRSDKISIINITHNLLQSESYMMKFERDLLSTLVRNLK